MTEVQYEPAASFDRRSLNSLSLPLVPSFSPHNAEGHEFGSVIATQILKGFIEEFARGDLLRTNDAKVFLPFSNKLSDCISHSAREALERCAYWFAAVRGTMSMLCDSYTVAKRVPIQGALVVNEDETTASVGEIPDQLSLVTFSLSLSLSLSLDGDLQTQIANLQELLAYSADLSTGFR
jgi:hypothetical protein